MIGQAGPAAAGTPTARAKRAGWLARAGRMQPRTEPLAARGDEVALYRKLHRELQRAVAGHIGASRELIEDACQFAWLQLLASQPERDSIFGWLYVVALHEAYRLSAIERRDARLERLRPRTGPGAT